ncbi:threonine/serine exporter family protein [Brassicibacter mesophilus]|uniref:threonine/serine exporter family protein n=1 Tax=Brassicibacter mesophilus TaxID=745119 RepID=UPI003D1A68A8
MFLIKHFVYAFLSTIGFSILFNIPKDSVIKSGFAGAIGWIIYIVTKDIFSSPIAGAFFGAITVGIVGEVMAKYFKKPATIFIIPGVVPLVPGAGMYYTMLAVIEKDFIHAANLGTETIFIAASIACGIIISSSVSKIIKKQKERKLLNGS